MNAFTLVHVIEVCKVVDNSLPLNDIRVLWDFIRGDAKEYFAEQNVEEFLLNEWQQNTLPGKYKYDLIKYLSSHTAEQARKVTTFSIKLFNHTMFSFQIGRLWHSERIQS